MVSTATPLEFRRRAGATAGSEAAASIARLAQSFRIHLLAEGRSARTVESYLEALGLLGAYLAVQSAGPAVPRSVEVIRREDIEGFLADLRARGMRPATVSNRFKSLQQFFRWAVEIEELIDVSPMAKLKAPRIPAEPPAVLSDDELRKLLRQCEGKAFEDRRDMAIIRLLIDTGMRRAELAGLNVEDVDLERNTCIVLGKGSRRRLVPFGRRTAQALDRYLRMREGHPFAKDVRRLPPSPGAEAPALHPLWLGHRGTMTPSGLFQTVTDRARAAGLTVFLHQFRHGFAHSFLAAGGQENDLMQLAGWQSRQMLQRYGASAAAARARDNYHRQVAPGDRL